MENYARFHDLLEHFKIEKIVQVHEQLQIMLKVLQMHIQH